MANPNIVNVSTILGESVGWNLTNTVTTTLFTVSADKLIKVNRITVANVDGSSAATFNLYIDTGAQTSAGGTVASGAADIYLAKVVSVPAASTLVLVDTPIYLRESDVLKGGASASGDLDLFMSYEVIDDAQEDYQTMAHFAELKLRKDPTGFTEEDHYVVTRVIVVGNDIPAGNSRLENHDMHIDGEHYCRETFGGEHWKQTSYNAKFRHRYAGNGMIYDPTHDVFRYAQLV